MNFPLFIAKRIYQNNSDKKKVGRPATRIAVAGVAIGLAIMIISISVVFGFKHTIRDKVVGFGSHIQVTNFMSLQDLEQYPIQMNDSVVNILRQTPGVNQVQKYALKQGILKTDQDFFGILLKGVGADFDSTFIHQHLVEGSIPQFSDSVNSNQLLISKTISDKLGLKLKDKIFSYFIDQHGVRVRRFTVAGIYHTNLSQYDKLIGYTDLHTVKQLNGWKHDQASGAELSVADFSQLDNIAAQVGKRIGKTTDQYGETYSYQTIRDSSPQIFSWLDLLDLNVWIILALMLAVATVTMISGLLIIILERTSMIGLMKALGAGNRIIRTTFLWLATLMVGKGMIIGNVVGIGLVLLQHYTGLVQLDSETYYVEQVPVEINVLFILLLNIATLIINVLALIAPTYLVSKIHPAKSMRYE